ncbi:MAG: cysteine--tRNA ligase [Thermodesulfobacteriota bacterium]
MSLRIYNSQTKQKEFFVPLNPPRVGIYVCGVTVYDSCHVGHARSMIVFDTIVRYLKYKGFQVTYVRNFTDVDDKIIARSRQEGVDPFSLAERYIQEFQSDMEALGVAVPDHEPRATRHIAEIIALIQTLIIKETAYAVDGDVFFAVEKFSEYGALSKRSLEEMQAGARIEVDPRKRHPMDFALWKKGKPGEPVWDSPWGPGRPGWHIECSAMSSRYLGETFDIHGGGKDLIFPHHENEQAQSMAATSKPLARYWVHNGFVTIDGEKMSKSLGNFVTIQNMIGRYHPEAIRLLLLSRHYRSPLDYSDQALQEAQSGLRRFYVLLKDLEYPEERLQSKGKEPLTSKGIRETETAIEHFEKNFEEAMEDDFNTAQAIGHMFELARHLNRLMDSVRPKDLIRMTGPFKRAIGLFQQYGRILGILANPPQVFLSEEQRRFLDQKGLSGETIETLIADRNQARRVKDWTRADALRDQLKAMNIILKDSSGGTVWEIEE